MDWFQALCWVLGPGNQISTISVLKDLKVRGGVEQGKRYPRKTCKKMLTSLLKTGLRDGHSRRTDSAAGGGQHMRLPEEEILQGRVVATCTDHAEEQEKKFQGVSTPMQRLGEVGKFREMGRPLWTGG